MTTGNGQAGAGGVLISGPRPDSASDRSLSLTKKPPVLLLGMLAPLGVFCLLTVRKQARWSGAGERLVRSMALMADHLCDLGEVT